MSVHVLLIEPDISLADIYARMMPKAVTCSHVRQAQEAIDVLDGEQTVDVVITDIHRTGSNNGVEILHEIRSYEDWLDVPILVISDIPPERLNHVDWQRYGVQGFIRKHLLTPQLMQRQINACLGR